MFIIFSIKFKQSHTELWMIALHICRKVRSFFDGLTQSSDFNCEMNENTRGIKIDTILTVLYDVIVSCRFYDVVHLN